MCFPLIDMSISYLPSKAPLNDPKACASFMGLKPSTTKSHLVRAILESIAFRWVWLKRSVIFKIAQVRHVRVASFRSFPSLQKQAALWDDVEGNQHPHHKDQVQFCINSVEMIRNPTCMCGLAKWWKVPCYTQILRSLRTPQPRLQ